MDLRSPIFELECYQDNLLQDAKTCEKEASEAKREFNTLDIELGNLIVKFNKVVKLRKQAKQHMEENEALARKFRNLSEQNKRAIEILKSASD